MTFWFSIIPILSISIVLYCVWHFVTDGMHYMVLAFSHGRSNICSSVIASVSLSPRPPHSQWHACLSTVYETACKYRCIQYACVARGTISRGPDFLLRVLRCTPNGISFSFALASKRFTRRVQFKPPWKRHRIARLASRRAASHRTKALPSLPSYLSSLLAVACCRFMSPFCEYANITRRLLSLS